MESKLAFHRENLVLVESNPVTCRLSKINHATSVEDDNSVNSTIYQYFCTKSKFDQHKKQLTSETQK